MGVACLPFPSRPPGPSSSIPFSSFRRAPPMPSPPPFLFLPSSLSFSLSLRLATARPNASERFRDFSLLLFFGSNFRISQCSWPADFMRYALVSWLQFQISSVLKFCTYWTIADFCSLYGSIYHLAFTLDIEIFVYCRSVQLSKRDMLSYNMFIKLFVKKQFFIFK